MEMGKAKNSGKSSAQAKHTRKRPLRRAVTKSTRAIIRDEKLRGEWVEAVFVARSQEEGIPPSVPWGERRGYDNVVGSPGDFWAVQVKSTMSVLPSGAYELSICAYHQHYAPGAFDFLAAYVILEDVWYIIPEKAVRGMKSVSLCTEKNRGKYEQYREAWHLLKPKRRKKEEPIDRIMGCVDESEEPGVMRDFAYGYRDFVNVLGEVLRSQPSARSSWESVHALRAVPREIPPSA
jgi:hypothetical protein